MENTRIQAYISPEIAEKLRRMANADGVSISTLAGTLISKALSPGEGTSKSRDRETENGMGMDEIIKPIPGRLLYLKYLLEACTNHVDPSGIAVKQAKERLEATRVMQKSAKKEVQNG